MRFIVFGAGAVGGVVGGRLHEHGHEVVLIARGAHHDAIRDGGLRLEAPDAGARLDVAVVDGPAHLSFTADDVVLLAVKSQDTAGALRSLGAVAPPDTPVVCLQNGVANEPAALRRFARVYGISVMCPTAHLEPGVVQAYSAPTTGILDIGRYPSGVDDLAAAVAEALAASTFESVPRPDIMRWKHAKLLMNLGNAIEAVCGPSARGGRLDELVRREGEAALRAAGIAFATAEEDAARRGDLLRLARVGGQRRGGGSSWQSLQRRVGTVETDWLNGEVVLLGRLHGVPTPANEVLQRLAVRLAGEGAPPGSLPEEDVLAALGQSSTAGARSPKSP